MILNRSTHLAEAESRLNWKNQATEAEHLLRRVLDTSPIEVAALRTAFDRAVQCNVGALGGGSRVLLQDCDNRLGLLENEYRIRTLMHGTEKRDWPKVEELKKTLEETIEIISPGASPRKNSRRAVTKPLFDDAKRMVIAADIEAELSQASHGQDSGQLAHLISKAEQTDGVSDACKAGAKYRLATLKVESELRTMMLQRSPTALWDVIARAQLRKDVDTLTLNQALQCHAVLQAEQGLDVAMHGSCSTKLHNSITAAEMTTGVENSLLVTARQRHESLAAGEALRHSLADNDPCAMKNALARGLRIQDYNPAVHVLVREASHRCFSHDVEQALQDGIKREDLGTLREALAIARQLVFCGSVGVNEAVLNRASYMEEVLTAETNLNNAAAGEDINKLKLAIERAQHADRRLGQRFGMMQVRLVRASVWARANRQKLALDLRTELENPHSATMLDYINRARALEGFDAELLARAEDQLDALAVEDHVRRCNTAIMA